MIVAVVLLVGIALAFGQDSAAKNQLHGFVEQETVVSNGKATPQVKTNITYGGKGKVGAYCFAQTSRHFSQVYCGVTDSPKKWLEVGVAIGAHTGLNPFQAAGFIWTGAPVGKKFVQNLLLVEKAGKWYRDVFGVKLNDRFTVSLASQRYRGTGPRGDIKITNRLSLGAEVNFSKSSSFIFGTRYSF
jgi:hypothetical protein